MIDVIEKLKIEIRKKGFVYKADIIYMNSKTYDELKAQYIATTYWCGAGVNNPATICGLKIRTNNALDDYEFEVIDSKRMARVRGRYHNILSDDCIDALRYCMEDIKTTNNIWCKVSQPTLPKRYIVNADAGILFWADGTKTVVKRCEGDDIDPVKAFLWAYFEHTSGLSKTKANKYLRNVETEYIKHNCKPVETNKSNELILETGKEYKVIDNLCGHEFKIGEIITCINAKSGKFSNGNKYYWLIEDELEEICMR